MSKFVAFCGAGILLVLIAAAAAAAWYMLGLPGKSFTGPPPPATRSERNLAERLKRHVIAIASKPHNVTHYAELERAAAYIEAELTALGYEAQSQVFEADGKPVRNIEVVIPAEKSNGAPLSLVVGAHYDSDGDAPGANDNGTGAAAVIELARMLKDVTPGNKSLRLVLFVNEEDPYYRTDQMGSLQYARSLKERGERVAGMISLETIGFFSDAPGSQEYPFPFGFIFPSTANFLSFVAMPGSRTFLHEVLGAFRRNTMIPTMGGTAPDLFEGIGWSDHWSFWQLGYPAVMVTDTALYRYPYYHTPEDTPEKVNYEMLARVTIGFEKTIRDLLQ